MDPYLIPTSSKGRTWIHPPRNQQPEHLSVFQTPLRIHQLRRPNSPAENDSCTKLTGAEATTGPPDPEANDLTSLSPMPEDATARWRRSRRTLFHHSSSTSTLRSPPGDTNLDKLEPTLHSRAENHPFPSHPRPTRPPEAKKNGGLADWSTRFSRRLRSRREKGRGFERKAATISEVLALSCVGFQRCVVR